MQEGRDENIISPLLQHHHLVSVQQNVRSDPPTEIFHEYHQLLLKRRSSHFTTTPVSSRNQFIYGTRKTPPDSGPFPSLMTPIRCTLIQIVAEIHGTPKPTTRICCNSSMSLVILNSTKKREAQDNPPMTHNKKTRAIVEIWQ